MNYLYFFFFCVLASTLTAATPNSLPVISEYHVQKKIGEGDQARVYKAQDSQGTTVAIKVFYTKSEVQQIHPEKTPYLDTLFSEDGSSSAAQLERDVAARLDHPNIMKLYAHASTLSADGEKREYVVLEYVHGSPIGTVTLSAAKAKKIAFQLINTLRHASEQGLLHCDLWSDNLFIDKKYNLKIIDLGSFEPLSNKAHTTFRSYWKAIFQIIQTLGIEKSLEKSLNSYVEQQKNFSLSSKNQSLIVFHLQALENIASAENVRMSGTN